MSSSSPPLEVESCQSFHRQFIRHHAPDTKNPRRFPDQEMNFVNHACSDPRFHQGRAVPAQATPRGNLRIVQPQRDLSFRVVNLLVPRAPALSPNFQLVVSSCLFSSGSNLPGRKTAASPSHQSLPHLLGAQSSRHRVTHHDQRHTADEVLHKLESARSTNQQPQLDPHHLKEELAITTEQSSIKSRVSLCPFDIRLHTHLPHCRVKHHGSTRHKTQH